MNIPLDIMIKDRVYQIEQLSLFRTNPKNKEDKNFINKHDKMFLDLFTLDTKIISYLVNLNSTLLSENEIMKEFCERKIKIGDIVKPPS